jgi:calcium binding protein 39
LLQEGDQQDADVAVQLAQEIYSQDLLFFFILHLANLPFEARKDVLLIFTALLKRHIGVRLTTVEYLAAPGKDTILTWLILGYESQETALLSGMMLRECLKHESLTKIIFTQPVTHSAAFIPLSPSDISPHIEQPTTSNEPLVYKLFDYVELPTFDIASDAFATLKVTE